MCVAAEGAILPEEEIQELQRRKQKARTLLWSVRVKQGEGVRRTRGMVPPK